MLKQQRVYVTEARTGGGGDGDVPGAMCGGYVDKNRRQDSRWALGALGRYSRQPRE